MKTLLCLIADAKDAGVFDCCTFDMYQSAYLDVVLKKDVPSALKVLADLIPVTQVIGVPIGNLRATGREKLVRNYFYQNKVISTRAIMIDLCCTLKDVPKLAVATQRCLKKIRLGIKKILMMQMGEYVEADFFMLTMLYKEATTKKCSKCGDIKLVSAFAHRHKNCFDLQSWCRKCFKANQVTPKFRPEYVPQSLILF